MNERCKTGTEISKADMRLVRLSLGNDPEARYEQGQGHRGEPVGCRSKVFDCVFHLNFLSCIVFLTNAIAHTLIMPAPNIHIRC